MKRIIHTKNAPNAVGPYSQAIAANGMLYISGQIPIDPATGVLSRAPISEQTELVMKNIGEILKEAGCSFDNVIKYSVFLKDLNNFSAMNEIFSRYYPENPPARATVEVARLPLDADIEIETIAVL